MQAGKYRHRIIIQDMVSSEDELGSNVITPTKLVTVRAKVEIKSGGEKYTEDKDLSIVVYEISIRRRPGIDASQTILLDGKTLEVKAVKDDGLSREITLVCTAHG